MKTLNFICIASCLATIPFSGWAASCSRANLTRCLDSVCAINLSSNPAARCQYCGTASAGAPKANGMRSVSTGSTKYTISDKELKSAPNDDPGQRYVWGTEQCLKKLPDCTPDDVSETYDGLIEQSCTAAGISQEMANITAKAKKAAARKMPDCETDISECVTRDNKCGIDYSNCKTDSDFDRVFAECAVEVSNCTEHTASIKTKLKTTSKNLFAAQDNLIDRIIASYKQARESKLAEIRSGCTDSAARDKCVATVCANNMRDKCQKDIEKDDKLREKPMAISLCSFYETACRTIK